MQALAEVYTKINDDEAQKFYLKTIESYENIFGKEHQKTIGAYNEYTDFLAKKRKSKQTF